MTLQSDFQESLVYQVPYWDKAQFNRFRFSDETCDFAVNIGRSKIFSFPQFAIEVFHRFYSAESSSYFVEEGGTLLNESQIKPEACWAKKLHDEISASENFALLQTQVLGRSFMAGLAANVFLEEIANRLSQPKQPLQDPAQLRRVVVSMRQNKAQIQDPKLVEQLVKQGKKVVQEIQDWSERMFEGSFESNSELQTTQSVVAAAVAAASKAVEGVEEAFTSIGWGLEPGQEQQLGNPEELFKLSNKIQSEGWLRAILKSAGRLKKIASRKQETKTRESYQEIVDLSRGSNLFLTTASELGRFYNSTTRTLFLKDYVEENLQQYKMGGKERLGLGPIIVCQDESGSMVGYENEQAKAISLAMLGIAKKQKRHFRMVHFDKQVTRIDDFTPKEKNMDKLISSLKHFTGGGTNWGVAIDAAVDCIRKHAKYKDADILLITDGNCGVSDDWIRDFKKAQKELKFKIHALVVGCKTSTLESFVDIENIVCVRSLGETEKLAKVFEI